MARELSDVLHYFLSDAEGGAGAPLAGSDPETIVPIAVPVGGKDAVRVAFVWNLAVEIAHAVGRAVLLAPDDDSLAPLRECLPVPTADTEGVGPEFAYSGARDLGTLARDARELGRSPQARSRTLCPTLLPSSWIHPDPAGRDLLRRPLLFTTPEPTDLNATQALLERIFEAAPDAEPGLTVHGVASISEAARVFDRLALRCESTLGRPLRSYGLLLDDLEVYRAVVSRRPVAIARPHSLAARALADVARLLVADYGPASSAASELAVRAGTAP